MSEVQENNTQETLNETHNQNFDTQVSDEEAPAQTEAPQNNQDIGAQDHSTFGAAEPPAQDAVPNPADIADPAVTMSTEDLVDPDPKVTMNPEDLVGSDPAIDTDPRATTSQQDLSGEPGIPQQEEEHHQQGFGLGEIDPNSEYDPGPIEDNILRDHYLKIADETDDDWNFDWFFDGTSEDSEDGPGLFIEDDPTDDDYVEYETPSEEDAEATPSGGYDGSGIAGGFGIDYDDDGDFEEESDEASAEVVEEDEASEAQSEFTDAEYQEVIDDLDNGNIEDVREFLAGLAHGGGEDDEEVAQEAPGGHEHGNHHLVDDEGISLSDIVGGEEKLEEGLDEANDSTEEYTYDEDAYEDAEDALEDLQDALQDGDEEELFEALEELQGYLGGFGKGGAEEDQNGTETQDDQIPSVPDEDGKLLVDEGISLDWTGEDSDGDGIEDSMEDSNGDAISEGKENSDGDGLYDWQDSDSDGNGIEDWEEIFGDLNENDVIDCF
jgi:large repetitive protein